MFEKLYMNGKLLSTTLVAFSIIKGPVLRHKLDDMKKNIKVIIPWLVILLVLLQFYV